MNIVAGDLDDERVIALLDEHLQGMADHSPPESIHALNLNGLKAPNVTFWTIWDGDDLCGCGALQELDREHGEIKSMRTAATHLRKGVAAKMLEHILEEARCRGYSRLSLETGSARASMRLMRFMRSTGSPTAGHSPITRRTRSAAL